MLEDRIRSGRSLRGLRNENEIKREIIRAIRDKYRVSFYHAESLYEEVVLGNTSTFIYDYNQERRRELMRSEEEIMRRVQNLTIRDEEGEGEENECAICLGEIIDERILDCNHSFCRSCINRVKPKRCPMCRKKFRFRLS